MLKDNRRLDSTRDCWSVDFVLFALLHRYLHSKLLYDFVFGTLV